MDDSATTGATIAFAGVFMGLLFGVLKDIIDRREKRKNLYREKCEEITTLLVEGLKWYNRMGLAYSWKELKENPPPFENTKIVMLTKLYFPELEDTAITYCNSVIKLYHLMLDSIPPMSECPASVAAVAMTHNKTEYNALNGKIDQAKRALEEGITQEVKKHL